MNPQHINLKHLDEEGLIGFIRAYAPKIHYKDCLSYFDPFHRHIRYYEPKERRKNLQALALSARQSRAVHRRMRSACAGV